MILTKINMSRFFPKGRSEKLISFCWQSYSIDIVNIKNLYCRYTLWDAKSKLSLTNSWMLIVTIASVIVMSISLEKKVKEKCSLLIFLTTLKLLAGKPKNPVWAAVSVCGLNPFSFLVSNHESWPWCSEIPLTSQPCLHNPDCPSCVSVLSWNIKSRYLQTSQLIESLLIHALNVYPFLTFCIFRCNLLCVCCPSRSTHPWLSLNTDGGHNSFPSQHLHCQSLFFPEWDGYLH